MSETGMGPPANQESKNDVGLRCPKCGCGHFLVTDTRKKVGGKIMRRRRCRNCGKPAYTIEMSAAEYAKLKSYYR